MRNAVLAGLTPGPSPLGSAAPTRQGGMKFVPTPMKGGITLPNFSRMNQFFLDRRAENNEDFNALKVAGGASLARRFLGGGGVGWSGSATQF